MSRELGTKFQEQQNGLYEQDNKEYIEQILCIKSRENAEV